MRLSEKETATVLAALRHWQLVADPLTQSPEHFAAVEPLTVQEISALCERVNLGEEETEAATNLWKIISFVATPFTVRRSARTKLRRNDVCECGRKPEECSTADGEDDHNDR